MAELVLNRFRIEIKKMDVNLSFFLESELKEDERYYLARYKPSKILEWKFSTKNGKKWLEGFKKKEIKEIKEKPFIYVSFFKPKLVNSEFQSLKKDEIPNLPKNLQKKFLIEEFIQSLKGQYIIEPYREGTDLSVYKQHNNNNDHYIRFDIVFNIFTDKSNQTFYEATVAIGSTDTYILQIPEHIRNQIRNKDVVRYLKNNLLIKNTQSQIDFTYPVKANREIRRLLNIPLNPRRKFYKEYYKLIDNFIRDITDKFNNIKLHTNFTRASEINTVSFEKNKMLFKDDNKDYSTVNGMRDYGPYQVPEDIKNIQLLFIYPDGESANKLYEYLSRGYRHFPGLESYVGIPANVYSKKICYENSLNTIVDRITQELTENNYNNLIAVCIMPFSKSTATEEDSKKYYKIKKILLEKNIPSQFIHRNKLFEENFHFSLPNIAIAMLAKCGGIPWKLATPHYNQLTVGFNIFTQKNGSKAQTFLGSAVFFDNEGIIRQVTGFSNSGINEITVSLISAISKYKNYKLEKKENIDKLVIHFYKTINNKDVQEIENITKENLGKDASFAIVEINDTKTTSDLCFDLEYDSLMPHSGTYIQLKPNEYLLFNNLRYWERPINPITQEELPIKLRIFDPYNNFNSHELISQVYEFSRMYWKSLKQKAQPVTTIYSKLIANYVSGFGNTLPDTDVTKKRVWFI